LRNRKTDSEEKIVERVRKAAGELQYASKFDIVLVNDDLDEAKKEACKLIENFIKKY